MPISINIKKMYWSCSNAENRRLFETNIIEIDLFCLIMRRPWLQTIQTILYNTHKFIHINYDQNDQSKKIWRKQTMLYACSNFFSLLLAEYIYVGSVVDHAVPIKFVFRVRLMFEAHYTKRRNRKEQKKSFFPSRPSNSSFLNYSPNRHTQTHSNNSLD